MKYAIVSDNSVGWFHYAVRIDETEKEPCFQCKEGHDLRNISNDWLNNLFARPESFGNMLIAVPGHHCMNFYGSWISEYEFNRVKRMAELQPALEEYAKLGKL